MFALVLPPFKYECSLCKAPLSFSCTQLVLVAKWNVDVPQRRSLVTSEMAISLSNLLALVFILLYNIT